MEISSFPRYKLELCEERRSDKRESENPRRAALCIIYQVWLVNFPSWFIHSKMGNSASLGTEAPPSQPCHPTTPLTAAKVHLIHTHNWSNPSVGVIYLAFFSDVPRDICKINLIKQEPFKKYVQCKLLLFEIGEKIIKICDHCSGWTDSSKKSRDILVQQVTPIDEIQDNS